MRSPLFYDFIDNGGFIGIAAITGPAQTQATGMGYGLGLRPDTRESFLLSL